MNSHKRIPKLRQTQVQKNYIAIWYSLVIHFIMVIILVNYNKIEIKDKLYELKDGLREVVFRISAPSIKDKKINELFTEREISYL